MKKHIILLFTLILLVPSFVFSDVVSFKVSYFIPRAESDLWETEFENMNFTKNDFHATFLCFGYEYFLNRQISFIFSVDPYYRRKMGSYKEYVGYQFEEGDFAFPTDYEGEFSINHLFDVSITPICASLKLAPFGRRGKLIPYIGAGGGVFLWNIKLQGNIVDFDDAWIYEDPDYGDVDIYKIEEADIREENKIGFGYQVFGGFMCPVGRRLSIDAEFKYSVVKGHFKEGDEIGFEGFEPVDLSGYQISVGISYWF